MKSLQDFGETRWFGCGGTTTATCKISGECGVLRGPCVLLRIVLNVGLDIVLAMVDAPHIENRENLVGTLSFNAGEADFNGFQCSHYLRPEQ